MRRRGFTLIEILVVLSLLALVAVLAYGYFGDIYREVRSKQAASKIHRDLTAVSNAINQHLDGRNGIFMANPAHPAHVAAAVGASRAILISKGYLKEEPKAKSTWAEPGCPTSVAYQYPQDSTYGKTYWNPDNAGSYFSYTHTGLRSFLLMRCVSDDICKQFNELGPLGTATIPNYTAQGNYSYVYTGKSPVPICFKGLGVHNTLAWRIK